MKFAKQSTGRQFGDMRTVHGKVQYVTVAREVAVGQVGQGIARDAWMEYCKPDLLLLMHCGTPEHGAGCRLVCVT